MTKLKQNDVVQDVCDRRYAESIAEKLKELEG
jgi:hypothetical protein